MGGIGENVMALVVALLVLERAGTFAKLIIDSVRGSSNGNNGTVGVNRNGIPVKCPGPSPAFEDAARESRELLRGLSENAIRQTAILENQTAALGRIESKAGALLDRLPPRA